MTPHASPLKNQGTGHAQSPVEPTLPARARGWRRGRAFLLALLLFLVAIPPAVGVSFNTETVLHTDYVGLPDGKHLYHGTSGDCRWAYDGAENQLELECLRDATNYIPILNVTAGKSTNWLNFSKTARVGNLILANALEAGLFEVRNATVKSGKLGNALDANTHDLTKLGALTFGSGQDTNLYRSAANTLKTDDALIVEGEITLGAATQDYKFTGYNEALAIQAQSSGAHASFNLFNKDGDGTDNAVYRAWKQGTPGATTNGEWLEWGVSGGSANFHIASLAQGQGTAARPIHIYTGGNPNQFVLSPDASISIGTNSNPQKLTVSNGSSPFSIAFHDTSGTNHYAHIRKNGDLLQIAKSNNDGTTNLNALLSVDLANDRVVPGSNNAYNLGSSALKWANVYTVVSNVGDLCTTYQNATWWCLTETATGLLWKDQNNATLYEIDADGWTPPAVAQLPTCNAAARGKHVYVEGGAGIADQEYVCRKTASDTYEWAPTLP